MKTTTYLSLSTGTAEEKKTRSAFLDKCLTCKSRQRAQAGAASLDSTEPVNSLFSISCDPDADAVILILRERIIDTSAISRDTNEAAAAFLSAPD